jgi:5-methylcytosine-specific restriction endonuclease McrA
MAKPKKTRVPKTRGSNTLTESAFWGMIRSALRQKSRWWKPVQEVKQAARRPNESENKRLKFEYQCAICSGWFPDKQIEVDHIIAAGSLTCGEDLHGFVERLFCEKDGLRVLCEGCHREVTNNQRAKNK